MFRHKSGSRFLSIKLKENNVNQEFQLKIGLSGGLAYFSNTVVK